MTTYTAGPWTVDRGQVRSATGDVLASVPFTLGDAQDAANARLIAAAPELAAAAAALLERLDNMTTDEFAAGGERTERERLRAVLEGLQ